MYTQKFYLSVILICLLVIVVCRNTFIQFAAICCLVVTAYNLNTHRKSNVFKLHLIQTDGLNENLLVKCNLMGTDTIFMIDTGYAGPPVISASYLAVNDPVHLDIAKRYATIVEMLETRVTENEQHSAIDRFISSAGCKTYTSGCTMRLMGIGSTQEQQADMFMCDMLKLETKSGHFAYPKLETNAHADMFVSNPLPTSVHILTCDFLLHSGPVWIDMEKKEMIMNMSPDQVLLKQVKCKMLPMVQSGGSFVVDIKVGGHICKCTVDTGAPGPISIDAEAANRLIRCTRKDASVQQTGVNGENICSEIITTDIEFAGNNYQSVPVFVNNLNVDFVDGYVGMSFLRAFNILLTDTSIGFEKNRLDMTSSADLVAASTRSGCNLKMKAC